MGSGTESAATLATEVLEASNAVFKFVTRRWSGGLRR
jgi:hypothetical protein